MTSTLIKPANAYPDGASNGPANTAEPGLSATVSGSLAAALRRSAQIERRTQ